MTFFNCSSAQADIFDTASTMNSRAFSLVTPTFFIHSCGVSIQTGLAGALVDVLAGLPGSPGLTNELTLS